MPPDLFKLVHLGTTRGSVSKWAFDFGLIDHIILKCFMFILSEKERNEVITQ